MGSEDCRDVNRNSLVLTETSSEDVAAVMPAVRKRDWREALSLLLPPSPSALPALSLVLSLRRALK